MGQLWDNIETTLGPHGGYLFNIGEAYFLPIGSIWQSKGEGSNIIDYIWLNDLMLYFKNCQNTNG